MVTRMTKDHVHIKFFGWTFDRSQIKFGFAARILLIDIADFSLLD